MNLTQEFLQSKTLPHVFENGGRYFLLARVGDMGRKESFFQAKVRGSNVYEVSIWEDQGQIHANCSCPYEATTYCKHIVAFGLTIIRDGNDIPEISSLSPTTALVDVRKIREAVVASIPNLEVFNNYGKEMQRWLAVDDHWNGLLVLAGMYEGFPAGIQPWMKRYCEEIERKEISIQVRKAIAKWILERWDHYEEKSQGLDRPQDIRYKWAIWEPCLEALISDKVMAHYVRTLLEGYGLLTLPELRQLDAKISGFMER